MEKPPAVKPAAFLCDYKVFLLHQAKVCYNGHISWVKAQFWEEKAKGD